MKKLTETHAQRSLQKTCVSWKKRQRSFGDVGLETLTIVLHSPSPAKNKINYYQQKVMEGYEGKVGEKEKTHSNEQRNLEWKKGEKEFILILDTFISY